MRAKPEFGSEADRPDRGWTSEISGERYVITANKTSSKFLFKMNRFIPRCDVQIYCFSD